MRISLDKTGQIDHKSPNLQNPPRSNYRETSCSARNLLAIYTFGSIPCIFHPMAEPATWYVLMCHLMSVQNSPLKNNFPQRLITLLLYTAKNLRDN